MGRQRIEGIEGGKGCRPSVSVFDVLYLGLFLVFRLSGDNQAAPPEPPRQFELCTLQFDLTIAFEASDNDG